MTVEQAAADFGVHAITPWKWVRRADVDAGTKPGTTGQEITELRAYLSQAYLPGKGSTRS
ncbi:hypothetical protein ACFYX5_11035 [Streptomyces rubiginosohelvolus]|uniref:hypothetical protein n=1 Tax=Streptomyces rubiginosohelvolus TaxID=67362 RepID=UPI0036AA9181